MAQTDEEIEEQDPFAPENVGVLSYIMLARIYDLLMVDLNERHPEVANEVLKTHAQGHILSLPPVLSGRFIAMEELEKEESTGDEKPSS